MIIANENKYDSYFEKYGGLYDLSPLFLKAQVKQESLFNPKAVSKVGAMGLAQFMPPTWKEWGIGDPYNPEDSIKAQAKYMNFLRNYIIRYTKQDVYDWTLCACNWGIGRIVGYKDRSGKYYPGLAKLHLYYANAKSYMPSETQTYVEKINGYYNDYLAKYYLDDLGKIQPKPLEEIK